MPPVTDRPLDDALDTASDLHPADYPYGELGLDYRARTLPNGH
jgi:hypothetical protein